MTILFGKRSHKACTSYEPGSFSGENSHSSSLCAEAARLKTPGFLQSVSTKSKTIALCRERTFVQTAVDVRSPPKEGLIAAIRSNIQTNIYVQEFGVPKLVAQRGLTALRCRSFLETVGQVCPTCRGGETEFSPRAYRVGRQHLIGLLFFENEWECAAGPTNNLSHRYQLPKMIIYL